MDEQTVIDAGKNLMSADPVWGSAVVILMAAITFLIFWIKGLLRENSDAKNAHLEDVRKYAAENEAVRSIIGANTEQIRANTDTMRTLVEIVRERVRG